ncbi:MAG: DUF445 family protein [Pseudomonadota bacterium]
MDDTPIPKRMGRSLLARESLHWASAGILTAIAGSTAACFSKDWVEAALLVATGALAGYLTNDIAITMLFWPTEKRLGGLLYGMFFKEKDHFGEALIERACEKFLNPKLFTDLLQHDNIVGWLNGSIKNAVDELAEVEVGTPRAFLATYFPDDDERELLYDQLSTQMGNFAAAKILENASRESIQGVITAMMAGLGGLHPAQFGADHDGVQAAVKHLFETCADPLTRNRLKAGMVGVLGRALDSQTSLSLVMGPEVSKRIEDLSADYFHKVALRELARKLKDPAFRASAAKMVRDHVEPLVRAHVQEMEGLRGWLIKGFGAATIDEALDKLSPAVDSFLLESPKALSRPEIGLHLEDSVRRGVREILELRLDQLRAWMPDEMLEGIADSVLDILASDGTKKAVTEGLTDWLSRKSNEEFRTLAPALFEAGDTRDNAVAAVSRALCLKLAENDVKHRVATECRIKTRRVVIALLDAAIPRLKDLPFLKPAVLAGLGTSAADLAACKLLQYAPEMASRLPIREKMWELWNSMTNRQIKEMVQTVLDSQLKVLINLGISFGAAVGCLCVLIQTCLGPNGAGVLLLLLVLGYRVFKAKVVDSEG